MKRCSIQLEFIWERDIHDSAHQQHISGGVKALKPSPGRVLFLHCGVVITNEVTEQTAVILDVMLDRTREPIGVNKITIAFVILLVAGVIHHECI